VLNGAKDVMVRGSVMLCCSGTFRCGFVVAQVGSTPIPVKCRVMNLSFSGHADGKGVMQLIRQVQPKAVVLVHGEAGKMELFKLRVISELKLPCYNPANLSRVREADDA
jgi:Cft2 family RNA processing exonuclease